MHAAAHTQFAKRLCASKVPNTKSHRITKIFTLGLRYGVNYLHYNQPLFISFTYPDQINRPCFTTNHTRGTLFAVVKALSPETCESCLTYTR